MAQEKAGGEGKEEGKGEEGRASKKEDRKETLLYMSQVPFSQNMLKEEE